MGLELMAYFSDISLETQELLEVFMGLRGSRYLVVEARTDGLVGLTHFEKLEDAEDYIEDTNCFICCCF